MRHFALTHSLTLIGNEESAEKIILLLRRQNEGALPCYCLRVDGADFEQAIAIGQAALSEKRNVAVVIAEDSVADGAVTESIARVLTAANLPHCQLLGCA
jgi:hypothetical protein